MCHSRGGRLTDSHMFQPFVPPGPTWGTAAGWITNKGAGSIHFCAPWLPFSQLAVHSRDAAVMFATWKRMTGTLSELSGALESHPAKNSQAQSVTLHWGRLQSGGTLHHDLCGLCEGL